MSDEPVIQQLRCLRCGYAWYPRSPKRPAHCPNRKCNSPYWDKPRRKPSESQVDRVVRKLREAGRDDAAEVLERARPYLMPDPGPSADKVVKSSQKQ